MQVANQMAVLTARIARLDCPENWPNLLPVLSQVRNVRLVMLPSEMPPFDIITHAHFDL